MADKSGKEIKKADDSGRNLQSQSRKYVHPEKSNPYIEGILFLQKTAGNKAVQRIMQTGLQRSNDPDPAELISRANSDPWNKLDENVRKPIEQSSGEDLGNVKVHSGPASDAAAESLGARAYTIGSNIHIGREAGNGNETVRRQILAHEAVHTIQQGSRGAAMQSKMRVSSPGDAAEAEADHIAKSIILDTGENTFSQALALRDSLRGSVGITAVAAGIQRDITGKKKQPYGEFEIDFKKNDATAAGAQATEDGTIKFTPGATAPESSSIRFVQIVRTVDVSGVTDTAGANVDWSKVGAGTEAPRNQMVTKRDTAKNVAPGFYVDQLAAALSKRTKKSDSSVLPYYDAMLANPGNQIGMRKGKTIVPAILDDHPGFTIPVKFNFVTSAKASDTGVWYGTVLWGFETYLDKGVAKIKSEYHSFREFRGETTDAALKKFDEYYRNPGSSTAPAK